MPRTVHVFDPPARCITGTIGQPGERTFYVQAIDGPREVAVRIEKGQADVMAQRLGDICREVSARYNQSIDRSALIDSDPLQMPLSEEFIVGAIAIAYEATRQRVVMELLAHTAESFDESIVLSDAEDGPDSVRVFFTVQQAYLFAKRTAHVVAAGRPPCPMCKLPLETEGHLCVRLNGYRQRPFTVGSEFADGDDPLS